MRGPEERFRVAHFLLGLFQCRTRENLSVVQRLIVCTKHVVPQRAKYVLSSVKYATPTDQTPDTSTFAASRSALITVR